MTLNIVNLILFFMTIITTYHDNNILRYCRFQIKNFTFISFPNISTGALLNCLCTLISHIVLVFKQLILINAHRIKGVDYF